MRETDSFCREFADDAEREAVKTDVIVATSVIGRGCIAVYVHIFHACLLANVLWHAVHAPLAKNVYRTVRKLMSVCAPLDEDTSSLGTANLSVLEKI